MIPEITEETYKLRFEELAKAHLVLAQKVDRAEDLTNLDFSTPLTRRYGFPIALGAFVTHNDKRGVLAELIEQLEKHGNTEMKTRCIINTYLTKG